MSRRKFSEGVEVKFEDQNAITYALERQLYDRILRQIVSNDVDGFWKTGFFVERASATTVSVAAGVGYQIDTGQVSPQPQGRPIVNLESKILTIEDAHATLDRIDIVVTKSDIVDELTESRRYKSTDESAVTSEDFVVQEDWSNETIIVEGTPGASPAAPGIPLGYVKIAELYVTAVTGIASDAVTDSRTVLTIVGDGGGENPEAGDYPVLLDSSKNKYNYFVNTEDSREITLPVPTLGFEITFIDKSGVSDIYPFTVKRHTAGTKIQGLDQDYECSAPYGSWTFTTDGTDWFRK